MAKKILAWGSIAFAIFYVAAYPASAATMVRSLGNGLVGIATGIGQFFSQLFS
jgi:hypothetical protein